MFAANAPQEFVPINTGAGDFELGSAEDGKRTLTFTPANVEVDDVFTIAIGDRSISVTATGASVANVTGLLETAWNASLHPDFKKATATDGGTELTVEMDAVGDDFTYEPVATTTDGGGTDDQTLTIAEVKGKVRKSVRLLAFLGVPGGGTGNGTLRFESGAGGTAKSGIIPVSDDGTAGPRELKLPLNEAGWLESDPGESLSLEVATMSELDGFAVIQKIKN